MRVALLLWVLPTSVLAQSPPLPQTAGERGLAIDGMRLFADDGDPDFNMGFVSVRHRLNEGLTLLGDLPFFYAKGPPTPSRTFTGLGNPYAGIELQRPGSRASFELGERLPLMTDQSGVMSRLSPISIDTKGWVNDSFRFGESHTFGRRHRRPVFVPAGVSVSCTSASSVKTPAQTRPTTTSFTHWYSVGRPDRSGSISAHQAD
jgi:hypothetical protein